MADDRYEAIRKALEEERTSVERQLEEHGVSPAEDRVQVEVDEGFADSAQATAERSELLGMIEQLRSHRAEIVAALERMDNGTFGKCERCGQEIPLERLEAIPVARLCVRCKQEVG
jgi:DnaK suppressor protein